MTFIYSMCNSIMVSVFSQNKLAFESCRDNSQTFSSRKADSLPQKIWLGAGNYSDRIFLLFILNATAQLLGTRTPTF